VRLAASFGVLAWLSSQSSPRPLMTLRIVDGRPLMNWRFIHDRVSLTAERIDDNGWHIIRAYR